MPLPTLRNYQDRTAGQVVDVLPHNPVLVGPPGSGKTRMGVEILRRVGGRGLWLAHRTELIGQAAEALRRNGATVGIIQAGHVPDETAAVQVASVQTLVQRQPPKVDIIIADECHRFAARTYQTIRGYYPGVPIVGLTATPFRLDGQGLGDAGFGRLVVAAHMDELVQAGVLHDPAVYEAEDPALWTLPTACGPLVTPILDWKHMNRRIVADWLAKAGGRRTIAFTLHRRASLDLVAAFQAAGVAAEHLDGTAGGPGRLGAMARLAAGKTKVLSNCQLWTEGTDVPSLEVAILAKPTASLCLHIQEVGRVMRTSEATGKRSALVMDYVGNCRRHGPITQRIRYSLGSRCGSPPSLARWNARLQQRQWAQVPLTAD